MRGAARRGEADAAVWRDEGFTLIEVVVASVVLLIVLVPGMWLLATSSSYVSQSKNKVAAANLASGLLEQDRASADAQTWTSNAPTLTDTSASSVTVTGTPFSVEQTGGWCAESSGGWASYSSAPSTPAAYGVLATVTWQSGQQSLQVGTVLPTPATGVTAPSSGTCPL
jgi:prepilin-type N-terminal cleavage/methylation domain-containing protein